MRAWSPIAAAAWLLVCAGCSDDGGAVCKCGPGEWCNPATNQCEPTDGGTGCSPPCGPNASCNADKTCTCVSGWTDCNGDMGQTGGNGCECSTTCNGTTCSVDQRCDPSILNDCGNKVMYCKDHTCTACPAGKYNCDGVEDCESDTDCIPDGKCETYGTKTCGSQSQYCDNGTCKPCPAGTYNCSMSGGDCECTTGCDKTFCKAECTFESGCNDETKYCDLGTCIACPTDTYNCNGTGDCECTGGCNGTSCTGTTSCDYYDTNVCGGDQSKWCYQTKCIDCSSGFFNCNSTMGCECDSQGCNGTQCAGKCSGGECP
jgi:hypothetical protein